jgi:hypothetical protein
MDFWICVSAPSGTYWLSPYLQWLAWVWSEAPRSVGQGKLSSIPVTSILNGKLSPGLYTVTCIIDDNANGILDSLYDGGFNMVYVAP